MLGCFDLAAQNLLLRRHTSSGWRGFLGGRRHGKSQPQASILDVPVPRVDVILKFYSSLIVGDRKPPLYLEMEGETQWRDCLEVCPTWLVVLSYGKKGIFFKDHDCLLPLSLILSVSSDSTSLPEVPLSPKHVLLGEASCSCARAGLCTVAQMRAEGPGQQPMPVSHACSPGVYSLP